MITNSEEANKYYELVNVYIDNYTEKWKIKPTNLGKYLLKNDKLIKFLERNGLKDIKNIERVIKDIIEDRENMERDTVKTFENFKFFESDEFKVLDIKQCLHKGIEKSNIEHEKILADIFDVSLSHVDIVDSDKHLFKIEGLRGDTECVIYTESELLVIKQNIREYCLNNILERSIKMDVINLDIQIGNFINEEKFNNYIDGLISIDKIREIIKNILNCSDIKLYKGFIGIDPSEAKLPRSPWKWIL